nr:hypothetical protein [Navicula tsukamotoi]UXN44535.1 hypothetical protein [Navicula tsukamotoi]
MKLFNILNCVFRVNANKIRNIYKHSLKYSLSIDNHRSFIYIYIYIYKQTYHLYILLKLLKNFMDNISNGNVKVDTLARDQIFFDYKYKYLPLFEAYHNGEITMDDLHIWLLDFYSKCKNNYNNLYIDELLDLKIDSKAIDFEPNFVIAWFEKLAYIYENFDDLTDPRFLRQVKKLRKSAFLTLSKLKRNDDWHHLNISFSSEMNILIKDSVLYSYKNSYISLLNNYNDQKISIEEFLNDFTKIYEEGCKKYESVCLNTDELLDLEIDFKSLEFEFRILKPWLNISNEILCHIKTEDFLKDDEKRFQVWVRSILSQIEKNDFQIENQTFVLEKISKNCRIEVASDAIFYKDKDLYLKLVIRYNNREISTQEFVNSFYKIYNNGCREYRKISNNLEELSTLKIDPKCIGFEDRILEPWKYECETIITDSDNFACLSKEMERKFLGWASVLWNNLEFDY